VSRICSALAVLVTGPLLWSAVAAQVLQQDLATIPDGPRKTTGVTVGQAVAGSAAPQPRLDLLPQSI
jgi:hypothetical protein